MPLSPGGIFICRPEPLRAEPGDDVGVALVSDLHIGAPQVDYDAMTADLEAAKDRGYRLSINGDVLDCILPKDMKRFTPDSLHERLQGKKDVLGAQIKWAIEILRPYAHLIDMIGIGNHEAAVEKYHGLDPMKPILAELQKLAKHRIWYGGYGGFIQYTLQPRGKKAPAAPFEIYYHHGSGGASPVTGGTIGLTRKATMAYADILWLGHSHNRVHRHIAFLACPPAGSNTLERQCRCIITGAYMDTYTEQTQEDYWENDRRSNYAADAGLAPQGKGGARVALKPKIAAGKLTFDMEVTQ